MTTRAPSDKKMLASPDSRISNEHLLALCGQGPGLSRLWHGGRIQQVRHILQRYLVMVGFRVDKNDGEPPEA